MIENISYKDLSSITNILETSNNNIKKIIEVYRKSNPSGTVKMERFTTEVDGYINYLKNLYTINKDADIVLEKLKG